MSIDVETEIMPHIQKTPSCWFWKRGHGGNGRPYWKNTLVYRLTYQHFRGSIPDKKVLDHIECDNPRCVNPWHVEPRTQAQNLSRAGVSKNLGHYLGDVEHGRALGQESAIRYAQKGRKRDACGRFVGG